MKRLYDKRLDKVAHNTAPTDEVIAMLNCYESYYRDFNVAYFYDKWRQNHQGSRSYNWVKQRLQQSGLVKKTKPKGTHRSKRPRKPLPGMMLHQDGSAHQWVEGHLAKELRLTAIEDKITANVFLKDEFLPHYIKQFSCKSTAQGNAFAPWLTSHLGLDDI